MDASSSDSHPNDRPVPTWDLPTRIFHWALVLLIIDAWVSYSFGDVLMRWHMWNGYALLTLVLFRLMWGIWGSNTARFSGFVASPLRVVRYLRALARGEDEHYLGHNPAGGWSVLVLLGLILVQGVCGLFASDDILVGRLASVHRLGF